MYNNIYIYIYGCVHENQPFVRKFLMPFALNTYVVSNGLENCKLIVHSVPELKLSKITLLQNGDFYPDCIVTIYSVQYR